MSVVDLTPYFSEGSRSLNLLAAALKPDADFLQRVDASLQMRADLEAADAALQEGLRKLRTGGGEDAAQRVVAQAVNFGIAHGLGVLLQRLAMQPFADEGEAA